MSDISNILMFSVHQGFLDRRIVAQANALCESCRRVTLVSLPVELEGAGLDDRVRVILPQTPPDDPHRGYESRTRRMVKAFPPRLRSAAKWLWYASGHGAASVFRDLLCSLVPREEFDAIHCHDLPTLPAGAEMLRRWPQAKLVYDAHELYPFQYPRGPVRRYWHAVESRLIGRADAVITVNQSLAEEFERLYRLGKVHAICNSYHLCDHWQPVPMAEFFRHFGARPQGRRVLFHGSLTEGRNLRNLTLAMKYLAHDASLYYLGAGPMLEELQDLRRRQGLSNVHFAPLVPQRELLGYVAAAEAGVIPYNDAHLPNTRLCSPNKLYEFVEAGVPVCASDLPELGRFLTEYGVGLSGPMNTPREVAHAINATLDAVDRGQFPPPLFHAARRACSWPRQRQKLIELYESLGI